MKPIFFTIAILISGVFLFTPSPSQAGECDNWQIEHPNWAWCSDFDNLANCTTGAEEQCWKDNGYTGLPPYYTRPDDQFKITTGSEAVAGNGYLKATPQVGSTGAGYTDVDLGQGYERANYRFYMKLGQGHLSYPNGHGPSIIGHGTNGCYMGGTIEINPMNYLVYRTNSCFDWEGESYSTDFFVNKDDLPILRNNRWYLIEEEMIVDTNPACAEAEAFRDSRCNGVIRLYVDEQLVLEYTDINHGGVSHGVKFDTLYGPRSYYHYRSPYYKNGAKEEIAFDNFVVSTSGYIGPAQNENNRGTADTMSPYLIYIGLETFLGRLSANDCGDIYNGLAFSSLFRNQEALLLQSGIVLPDSYPDYCQGEPDKSLKVTITESGDGSGVWWERYSDIWERPSQQVIHGWLYLPEGNDYSSNPPLAGFKAYGGDDTDYANYVAMTVNDNKWAMVQRSRAGTPGIVNTSNTAITFNEWHEFEIILWANQTASLMIDQQRIFTQQALPSDVSWSFNANTSGSGVVAGVIDFQGTPPFTMYYDDVSAGSASFWSCDGWSQASCPFTASATVPAPITDNFIVTGPNQGGGPHIRIFNTDGQLQSQFFAYEQNFHGGVSVATGDINGDGTDEIITAPGPGLSPEIRVFSNNGTLIGSFTAYNANFTKGINIAAGDFDGNGLAEIVTAPKQGGGPNIRIFEYRNGGFVPTVENFMAYAENFRGGVSITSCDIEGDGINEIITGTQGGGGPHIRIFGIRNQEFKPVTLGFMAYAENFRGGINLGCGDVNGDGLDEIVTGVYGNGGPHLRIFGRTRYGKIGLVHPGFFAYNPQFRGGISASTVDYDNDGIEEIITGVFADSEPLVRIFDTNGTVIKKEFYPFPKTMLSGIFVASGNNY